MHKFRRELDRAAKRYGYKVACVKRGHYVLVHESELYRDVKAGFSPKSKNLTIKKTVSTIKARLRGDR